MMESADGGLLKNSELAIEILFQCVKFHYEHGKPITLRELIVECNNAGYKKESSIRSTAARLKDQGYFENVKNSYQSRSVISNPRTAKLAMEINAAGDHKVDETEFCQRAETKYVWRDGDSPNSHLEFLVKHGYCKRCDGRSLQTTHESLFGIERRLIERVAKLDSDRKRNVKWADLMPGTAKLLDKENLVFLDIPDIKELLKYIDAKLIGGGVFRSEWWIEITYGVGRLSSEGMIRENLRWTYRLTNTSATATKHKLTLMSAPHLQRKTGPPSFYEFAGSSARDLLPKAVRKTGVFARQDSEIELGPLQTRKLEMSYSQDWPVNPQHPTIHNCFSPKESAFGETRLTIHAPRAEKVGVLFKNSERNPNVKGRSPDTHVFSIHELILQEQVLEVLVTFQPTSPTSDEKIDKIKGSRMPGRPRTGE